MTSQPETIDQGMPLVRSMHESLGAALSNLHCGIQIRMVPEPDTYLIHNS
jgi:hypothetical protein